LAFEREINRFVVDVKARRQEAGRGRPASVSDAVAL